MQGRNSGYSDGVVDVSIIVPACFDNPLKESSIGFLSQVLTQRKSVVIPYSAIIGAYHIATRYLKAPRINVRRVLDGMLRTGSPALCGEVSNKMVSDALEYATVYDIESWDGVLVALCRSLGSSIIYSLDRELSKIREATVVNPFSEHLVKEYHDYIQESIG